MWQGRGIGKVWSHFEMFLNKLLQREAYNGKKLWRSLWMSNVIICVLCKLYYSYFLGLSLLLSKCWVLRICTFHKWRKGCSILTLLLKFSLGISNVVLNALKRMCDFLNRWNLIFKGPPAWKTREFSHNILCNMIKIKGALKTYLRTFTISPVKFPFDST